ncbi:MAG: cytidine/deoxycytidylate deaminase family protein [Flavobacteriales bacterium]
MLHGDIKYPDADKQRRYDLAYLRMAHVWSGLSKCQRKKVGSLIVKEGMIISDGYNGCPSGFPNACEDEEGNTHWYVLHAEANALTKLAKSNNSAKNGTLYITLSPCKDCSKLILQAGVSRVVYVHKYKDTSGLDFLSETDIELVHIPDALEQPASGIAATDTLK